MVVEKYKVMVCDLTNCQIAGSTERISRRNADGWCDEKTWAQVIPDAWM